MNIPEIVQKIQYMIAPAVMVSSSALLLLGFQNKFSNLANRFRVLNQEKRVLSQKTNPDDAERLRLKSLIQQVEQLMKRASYVKNAILFTYLAIISFVGASILLYLNVYVEFGLNHAIAYVILAGFVSLILTSFFMILETTLFYQVIALEKKG
jgi:Na+/melibiose symporter-like transporter